MQHGCRQNLYSVDIWKITLTSYEFLVKHDAKVLIENVGASFFDNFVQP